MINGECLVIEDYTHLSVIDSTIGETASPPPATHRASDYFCQMNNTSTDCKHVFQEKGQVRGVVDFTTFGLKLLMPQVQILIVTLK